MSARRYGGTYSPGGGPEPEGGPAHRPGAADPDAAPNRFRGRPATSVDVRAILMFVLPTPLLFGAFGAMGAGTGGRLALFLLAYASLMLGAWLLREGQRAAAAFAARSIARPPAFPRKLCAAALAGIGVFFGYWLGNTPDGVIAATGTFVQATIFGLLAIGAHVLAFGIDPMRSKGGSASIHQAEIARVSAALERAEEKLRNIERLAHQLRDREIDARVTRLNATVRDMIGLVERDPRDLSRARRYLGVYLQGAEDATRKYAETHERLNDPKLRDDYMALLGDLERSFARGRETLLVDDRADLEVEIEVLRDRLGQESPRG